MALLEVEEFVMVKYSVLDAALAWYQEKLGCRKPTKEEFELNTGDEPPDGILMLGYKPILFYSTNDGFPTTVPIIGTGKIDAAYKFLSERGVSCGAIQRDRAGVSFFEIHDLDGNLIEVTEDL